MLDREPGEGMNGTRHVGRCVSDRRVSGHLGESGRQRVQTAHVVGRAIESHVSRDVGLGLGIAEFGPGHAVGERRVLGTGVTVGRHRSRGLGGLQCAAGTGIETAGETERATGCRGTGAGALGRRFEFSDAILECVAFADQRLEVGDPVAEPIGFGLVDDRGSGRDELLAAAPTAQHPADDAADHGEPEAPQEELGEGVDHGSSFRSVSQRVTGSPRRRPHGGSVPCSPECRWLPPAGTHQIPGRRVARPGCPGR